MCQSNVNRVTTDVLVDMLVKAPYKIHVPMTGRRRGEAVTTDLKAPTVSCSVTWLKITPNPKTRNGLGLGLGLQFILSDFPPFRGLGFRVIFHHSAIPPFQLLGSPHVHVSKNLQSRERLSIHVYIENVVFWTRKMCNWRKNVVSMFHELQI